MHYWYAYLKKGVGGWVIYDYWEMATSSAADGERPPVLRSTVMTSHGREPLDSPFSIRSMDTLLIMSPNPI
ncbi:uncharacterized protein YALI1_B25319g [Yarrowia lipolytica]|uniref:Uncharacterized protein n=1 Tax=Yarrowia lipolytica TaxID=4952 RepID=A0A1D8N8G8_YARLL|nr:hypothetical protein YALI1_B25319g [Yarrowia lipolytica]